VRRLLQEALFIVPLITALALLGGMLGALFYRHYL